MTKKKYGFFTRMLLICTSLLVSFSVIASMIVGFLSSQYEKSQFLKSYELALVNLSEAFSSHIDSFSILVGRILVNNKCDENLCMLMNASSYDQISADTRNEVITLLSSICSNDRYLRGVLLYSPQNSMVYYYSDSQYYLRCASMDIDLPDLVPFAGTKLDNKTISDVIAACTRSEGSYDSYYGLAATLYRNAAVPLGYMIPIYSTAEFMNILNDYELDDQNSFRISDDNNRIYFQSNPMSDITGHTVYTNTVSNTDNGFQVSYEVMRMHLPKGRLTIMIVLLALFVTAFSFILYYVTYYLSNKNIGGILNGMKKFSLSDLSYRINRPQKGNEFTQIIDGFNKMCDELQKNVERSYVYELQQKKSELYALQTSINPHFLYNTLDMIRSQIQSADTGTASHMLLLLAKIYRTQTNTDMFITLDEEAELCENFIILYQSRFQNFDYEFDVDSNAGWYAIPKNTLQPMIENYFVHGIKSGTQDNLLLLSVFLEDMDGIRYVHITLCNNGNPISEKRISEISRSLDLGVFETGKSGSFAMANVYTRLRIAFGEKCRLTVKSGEDDISFQIDLIFPAMSADELQNNFLSHPAASTGTSDNTAV